ncbi:MAG: hypothetical protein Q8N18_22200, partial [Opitutaceae bacterium]|nr:hypothetical protein [Opitutaceae bacterium]
MNRKASASEVAAGVPARRGLPNTLNRRAGTPAATRGLLVLALALANPLPAAQPAPPGTLSAETDQLFTVGRQLFDLFAPAEIKAQYEFPTKERWDALVAKFQRALEGDSLQDLADCAREGRQALEALRLVPGYDDLADWLEQRIDSFEGARQSLAPKPPPPPRPPASPPPGYEPVPHYHLWLARVQSRAA